MERSRPPLRRPDLEVRYDVSRGTFVPAPVVSKVKVARAPLDAWLKSLYWRRSGRWLKQAEMTVGGFDGRVLVFEILGSRLRLPAEGEWRGTFTLAGTRVPSFHRLLPTGDALLLRVRGGLNVVGMREAINLAGRWVPDVT